MQLKTIIIDDEVNSIVTLEAMLGGFFDHLSIVAKAGNAVDGLREIRKHQPDILFLDVNMPGVDGLDMLEMLESRNFKVVITSGHEKHALRAIKNKVDDFLLKPVNIEELEKIVVAITEGFVKSRNAHRQGLIKLVDKNKTVFVRPDEIRYIRAEGRYSKVVCEDKNFLVTKNLGEFEAELDAKVFFRVHRSYLVNCGFVKNISNNEGGFIVLNDGTEVEVSRRKKTEFVAFMQR